MQLRLNRDLSQGPAHTYGVLTVLELVLQTIERAWIPDPRGGPSGHPDTSCVPTGEFALVLHDTAHHSETWALFNPELGIYHEPGDIPDGAVDARWGCLIHPDNVAATLQGCIGPGLSRGVLDGAPAVLSSRQAFAILKQTIGWVAGHTLLIEA